MNITFHELTLVNLGCLIFLYYFKCMLINFQNKGAYLAVLVFTLFACQNMKDGTSDLDQSEVTQFRIERSDTSVVVYASDRLLPVAIHHLKPDFRPYLHPLRSPHSDVPLTQYSPGHHRHQTGVYWGFTRINGTQTDEEELKRWFYRSDKPEDVKTHIGRDYFHNPGKGYWLKKEDRVLLAEGTEVKWSATYQLLDDSGDITMEETQEWVMKKAGERFSLELGWTGKAISDVVINEFDYGGLFVRMPWTETTKGSVVNAARQRDGHAEGQRAHWVDIGMQIEGLEQEAHIAVFDHPDNPGFPLPWRVDQQMGVGPAPARFGDVVIPEGNILHFRHQLNLYTGPFQDMVLDEWWGDFIGDHGMYNATALWGLAQDEGRNAQFLNAEQAVDIMSIQPGFQVNAFASEPMVTQPMAFCWDDKGRMWVAENRDYESRGHGFSNSGDSRIVILEDSDQDGHADKRTVFLEGIPFPAAIATGFDGLFLGAPPNLLFVPDKDHNDQADLEDIEVLLTGWGIRDRHETINSLHWGPDGWLYGLEGFATPSKIRQPNGKGIIYKPGEAFPDDLLDAEGIDINGGVWRYHPIKRRFEVVAHGFSNPWGIDYDEHGQLFISACVIPHLFHVIPGGIYHRQGGQHFNPYVYEDIRTIVDHRHRSAHGGARVYLSDAFPSNQHGRIFMANIHEHAVLSDILTPHGSGFKAGHGQDFLFANNAQWIGFSLEIGPEGAIYVLDWHDADICGQEVLNKETGRIYRITPEHDLSENWPGRFEDLSTMTDLDLSHLQKSASAWHARRARTLLQFRSTTRQLDQQAVTLLEGLLTGDSKEGIRLRALWTLHQVGKLGSDQFLSLLKDANDYIRGWAIQLACEDGEAPQDFLEAMIRTAGRESSPVVRLYLAAALQRIPDRYKWDLAEKLVRFEQDSSDPNIPHMLWFGIEPLVILDAERVLEIAQKSKIKGLSEKIARRLVDAGLESEIVGVLKNSHRSNRSLLTGLLAGLEGKPSISAPEEWNTAFKHLQKNPETANLAKEINAHFNSSTMAEAQLSILEDTNADDSAQNEAIRQLSVQRHPGLLRLLREKIRQESTRTEAIRAMSGYDDMALAEFLLSQFSLYEHHHKMEVLQTLSSRSSYGWLLASAIKDGSIDRKEIPAYIAVQLRRVVGNGFVEIWGPIDRIDAVKQASYSRYSRMFNEAALSQADIFNGRQVYERSCAVCHKMNNLGGDLGPDLTGSNRTNLNYLLQNIIDPSAELQDDYRMVYASLSDGRTVAGNISVQNDQSITLKTIGQEKLVIPRSSIVSMEISDQSMMPEGLLENLSEADAIDLMAFLRNTPVSSIQ